MSLSRRALPLLGWLALALAACGSLATPEQQAVSNLQSALQAYNGESKISVTSTAAACRQASDMLRQDGWPSGAGGARSTPRILFALHHAYGEALRGLTDCAASAPFNYPRMAQADDEIRAANEWIARAQVLDRTHS